MHDYTIARCSRQCRLSNRELKPGERFYSVVVNEDGETLRYDVSETMWQGPPENAVGWWRNQMPPPAPKKRRSTSNKELVVKLGELCEDPEQTTLAHLLGLLLLRRRVLRSQNDVDGLQTESFATTVQRDVPPPDHSEDFHEGLHLIHPTTNREYFIPAIQPSSDDMAKYDEILQSLLFVDDSEDDSEDEDGSEGLVDDE